jgi:hypothetical protein
VKTNRKKKKKQRRDVPKGNAKCEGRCNWEEWAIKMTKKRVAGKIKEFIEVALHATPRSYEAPRKVAHRRERRGRGTCTTSNASYATTHVFIFETYFMSFCVCNWS